MLLTLSSRLNSTVHFVRPPQYLLNWITQLRHGRLVEIQIDSLPVRSIGACALKLLLIVKAGASMCRVLTNSVAIMCRVAPAIRFLRRCHVILPPAARHLKLPFIFNRLLNLFSSFIKLAHSLQ
jgi:hypothetical protein